MLRSPRPRCETYRKRHAPSDRKFTSSTPAQAARSRRPSPPSCASRPMPCSLPAMPSSTAADRGALSDSRSLFASRGCRSRRADELWGRSCGHVSSGRRLHGANPQRCKASRTAGLAVEQIRVRHQRANGEIARHRGAQRVATARRRGHRVRRRAFISLLASAAAAWPLAAHAQQPAIPVIGWLRAGRPGTADRLTAFRQGLNDLGYIEGRNVAVERRDSDQYDRLPELASELVRDQVTTIFADNLAAAVAARAATATIPIVFAIGGDPVRDG